MSCFMGKVLFEGVIYHLLCTNPHNVLVNYHTISAHSVERQSEHIHYSGDGYHGGVVSPFSRETEGDGFLTVPSFWEALVALIVKKTTTQRSSLGLLVLGPLVTVIGDKISCPLIYRR